MVVTKLINTCKTVNKISVELEFLCPFTVSSLLFTVIVAMGSVNLLTFGKKTRQIIIVVVNIMPAAWIANSSSGWDFRKKETGPAMTDTTTIVYIEIPVDQSQCVRGSTGR